MAAAENSSPSTPGPDLRYEAVSALDAAGRAGGGVQGDIPYAGAFDRLAKIVRQSQTDLIRFHALNMVVDVGGGDETRRFLLELATSRDHAAALAMLLLVQRADSQSPFRARTFEDQAASRTTLQRLWARVNDTVAYLPGPHGTAGKPSVPDPRALSELQVFARKEGWQTK